MSLEISGPTSGVFFEDNDLQWEFTVTLDGAAVDVSGMIFRFVMQRQGFATPVLTTEGVSPNATAAESDPENGKFTISVDADDTDDLYGTYEYQAQVEDGLGDKSNIMFGYFTFKPNLIA